MNKVNLIRLNGQMNSKLNTFLAACALTLAGTNADARAVKLYQQVPSANITASASSAIKSSPASNAVDGKGMLGDCHVANNLGEGMWVSAVSKNKVRYSKATREGAVWFLCSFDKPTDIEQLRVWNHNQNEHTRRGLRKVYIEYSADGSKWNLLADGSHDYHIIPESKGRNPEEADYIFSFPKINARYVCITAAAGGEGNYYDRENAIIMREAADMHQNPDYYGLAELRFYNSASVSTYSLDKITALTPKFSQGYLKTEQGPAREFSVSFDKPLYCGGTLSFLMNGKAWEAKIEPSAEGVTRYEGLFPAGYMEEKATLVTTLRSEQGRVNRTDEVPAARKWVVAFFPHSHQDIGYTHRQNDVMRLQWRNLERAMEMADRTRSYPAGARYKWNTEATWSIMGYLQEYAGTDKARRVIDAIKRGDICVDACIGSELTGISRQEELMHYFDDAHRIEAMTGVPCNTAMMSDVPGQVWGLVTAMANNGVKYYSPGPNYVPFYGKIGNDRAGALHIDWGDRPFYWQSQSGTDKVLVWEAGRGYSWFHGWLAGRLSVCGVEPVWEYLQELETDRFPYNTCYLRYTVHGDNGPPDELMPEVIKDWNERYDSPHFCISTSREFFEAFEKEYGDVLPVYAGDMTPTWEDGAASTARETAMNRESAARLARTGILWTMYRPGEVAPHSDFDEAWKNVALFSEHTWGAAGSGPEPDSKFTKDLWAGKKMYADSAYSQSMRLYDNALPINRNGSKVHVANTSAWLRTDVVVMDGPFDIKRQQLVNQAGEAVEVQCLSDGRWAFMAENIPALSSVVYEIRPTAKKRIAKTVADAVKTAAYSLDNGMVSVTVNPADGTISSLRMAGDDFEYAGEGGLNAYHYSGHRSADPQTITGVKSVKLIDNGPVLATLRIESNAPGCNTLIRDVTLYRGLPRVDVVNRLDKQDIRKKENVRFVFPFNFPHPDIAIDLAMSEMHPEREQLSGVNKHYYSLQNGLSVGDLEHGICMTSVDAPFVEFGSTSGEDYRLNPRHGYGWWRMAQISPVVYSWVMTNTWGTNYKASQGGEATFRYTLEPGNPHDLCLKQRGFEREHPLVAFRSESAQGVDCLFRLKGNNKIAVSDIRPSKDNSAYIVRLHNMDKEAVRTAFEWGSLQGVEVARCDWREEALSPVDPESFWLKPYEYTMLKITIK